jgi:hypothetical protein
MKAGHCPSSSSDCSCCQVNMLSACTTSPLGRGMAHNELERELERGEGWGAALTAGAILRNSPLRFRLGTHGGMTDHSRVNHGRTGDPIGGMMGNSYRCWCIGAFFKRSAERRLSTRTQLLFFRAHHATVFPTTSAARREVRLTLHSSREELRDERQAKHGQQQNGDEPTQ